VRYPAGRTLGMGDLADYLLYIAQTRVSHVQMESVVWLRVFVCFLSSIRFPPVVFTLVRQIVLSS
jgi:hypothetical protein